MYLLSLLSVRKFCFFSSKLYPFYLCKSTRKKYHIAMAVFNGKMDHHKGITIDSTVNICDDIDEFSSRLETSLKKWREDDLRGVWFKVSIPQVSWIPVLFEKGFKIHHAKDDIISLSLWLPEYESCKIPHYAHNMVGAGAVVINDKQQVLVVRERYRSQPFWKLPGGYVDPGEDIGEAAMREVLEETAIQTEFVSLVCLRHTPKSAFGCSDIYCIVRLRPLTDEITKQDEEVEDCQWMDIKTYLNHPEVHENNRMFVIKAIENEENSIIMKREKSEHPVTKIPQYLFSISKS